METAYSLAFKTEVIILDSYWSVEENKKMFDCFIPNTTITFKASEEELEFEEQLV